MAVLESYWNTYLCNTSFMNETTLNWQDMQLFLHVARADGLAGACEITGKSAPTLGRRMLALEASTGKDLFNRHTHGYELTDEGKQLMQTAIAMEQMMLSVSNESQSLRGRLVKISAGSWMSRALCRKTDALVLPEEAIRLRFISTEQALDINHRETIIGIRNKRPVSDTLATRKIGIVKFAGYALSDSIDAWISVEGNTPSSQWLRQQDVKTSPIEVTSPGNALDLALHGVGRVVLPTFVGDHEHRLQRVTSLISALSHEQWLVVHQDERKRHDVRVVIDRVYKVAKELHKSQ